MLDASTKAMPGDAFLGLFGVASFPRLGAAGGRALGGAFAALLVGGLVVAGGAELRRRREGARTTGYASLRDSADEDWSTDEGGEEAVATVSRV